VVRFKLCSIEAVVGSEAVGTDSLDSEERQMEPHRVGVERMEGKERKEAVAERCIHELADAADVGAFSAAGDTGLARDPVAVDQRRKTARHPGSLSNPGVEVVTSFRRAG
jgi:hypothetical protein